jgi:exodeoxyribonuclease V alpha subunit
VTDTSLLSAEAPETVAALDPQSLLGRFNRAGVLAAADVHVATTLGRLTGETDEAAVLGAAFAVRAPRVGHVYVDLSGVRRSASAGEDAEVGLDSLPWPDPDTWLGVMAASPMVSSDPGANPGRPLVLEGSALYLERMWRDEIGVAEALGRRATRSVPGGWPSGAGEALLDRVFDGEGAAAQRLAAATIVGRHLAVVAGGPGKGKTTTVARALAALFVEAAERGSRPPLTALAAPTGKAAARLAEAVRDEASSLGLDEDVRTQLQGLEAFTLHRLLGMTGGGATRVRHHAANPLPYDVVVVDETSMLALWLMARLVDAVRSDARLVLVGDPEQLASVEAGVVLADIVGPDASPTSAASAAGPSTHTGPGTAGEPRTAAGPGTDAGPSTDAGPGTAGEPGMGAGPETAGEPPIARCVVRLSVNYRFTGALAALAEAVRSGAADDVVAILRGGHPEVEWTPASVDQAPEAADAVAAASWAHARRLVDVARGAGAPEALDDLERFRLLCAHRRGAAGAETWNAQVERLVRADPASGAGSGVYVGLPLMVTANDYELRLFNGDVGVVVPGDDSRLRVVFRRGAETVSVSPMALSAVSSAYAMTIHKAQGSEFDAVAIVLPDPSSRVLTRELLYTAVTRARARVHLVGSEEAVRAGVGRRVARASGLMARLWGPDSDGP